MCTKSALRSFPFTGQIICQLTAFMSYIRALIQCKATFMFPVFRKVDQSFVRLGCHPVVEVLKAHEEPGEEPEPEVVLELLCVYVVFGAPNGHGPSGIFWLWGELLRSCTLMQNLV